MKLLRIYLDNCCYNRPFDDQSQLIVRLETEAILFIQQMIREEKFDLAWSSILDFENKKNPFETRREAANEFRELAFSIVDVTPTMKQEATLFQSQGVAVVDSLHLVCAISAGCDYFVTVDKGILKKRVSSIATINPIQFVTICEEKSR